MDYEKSYFFLFNAITSALEALAGGRAEKASEILKSAQLQTEEWYISGEGEE